MKKHEVICDRCGKNEDLNYYDGKWLLPNDGWHSFDQSQHHLCKPCFLRAIEKEPRIAKP